ncbi:MAG: S-layer homology domain-containing protein [Ruminococcaceae bacterium]|nr:S-layer homology domain-containing protein [Oscillospiraceae bacterium]
MMKKVTAFLFCAIILFVCMLSVSAADYVIWDFTDPIAASEWTGTPEAELEITEHGLKISGEGDNLNISVKVNEEVLLDDYSYVVFEYTGSDVGGGFQLYHWTSTSTGFPYISSYSGSCDVGVVRQHIFDLKATPFETAHWTGKLTNLRIDPFRNQTRREMIIKSLGFFKDADTYDTYVKEKASAAIPYGQPIMLYNPALTNPIFPLTGSNCVIDYKDNYAIVTSTNGPEEKAGNTGDPNFSVNAGFDGTRWQWMKIRLKNLSEATHFEMHFVSDATNGTLTGASCTHFPISSFDEEFVEYIVNVKDANLNSQSVNNNILEDTMWKGNIRQIRFDCMWKAEPSGQMPTGSQMYIDYIGFFRSEAEAKAFTPDPSTEIEKAKKNTGAPTPTWIFDNEEIISTISTWSVDLSLSGGALKVIPTTEDPCLEMRLPFTFDSAEFPIFAYRHKTDSTVGVLAMFYSSDKGANPSNTNVGISVDNSGVWSNVIVDMSTHERAKETWHGNITGLRIDPINGLDLEAEIYIDRFGFFRTRGEAMAFLNEGITAMDYSKPAAFTADYQKAIIPGGTLYEGYKESDFLLSSTTPSGVGTSPVVIRTDADGKQEIVALGYTNDNGFTSFVANKPANYTLGYNHKTYTDIAGHWGEGYINFVSDRTLFGGTSPTEFSPELAMTRGMFITVLGRMHGVDTSKYDGNTGYGDVPVTEYYAPYIQWAKENNLMAPLSEVTFGAEDPIYRETMAAVIANYAKFSGFNMVGYADVINFSDLAGVDATTVEAIEFVQKLGIINGKGGTTFDPKGYSTRAEVATVMERVIKTALGVNTASTAYTPDYFTRDRIRIGAWGFQSDFANEYGMQKLRDLGVDWLIHSGAVSSVYTRDIVLNYADKYGIAINAADASVGSSSVDDPNWNPAVKASEYMHHPSFVGHFFSDEPGTDYHPMLGALSKKYRELMPGKTPFVNLLPMYANAAQLKMSGGAAAIEYYDADPNLYKNYLQSWFDHTDSDFICVDIYPLFGTTGQPETWRTYGDYCESVNLVAEAARNNNAEFWCCIQANGWTTDRRDPGVQGYRFQSYTLLSYGCTSILLWSMDSGDDENALFNPKTGGVNQPIYDDCAKVMWEIKKLSDTYIQYKNLGAFTLNCTDSTPWLKMTNEYKDFTVLSETVSDEPLLIGCFDKKDGAGHAFTVVNMTNLGEFKPATLKFKIAQPLTVTLYDEAVPTVLTADAEGYYTINLDSGDGVFVTVG